MVCKNIHYYIYKRHDQTGKHSIQILFQDQSKHNKRSKWFAKAAEQVSEILVLKYRKLIKLVPIFRLQVPGHQVRRQSGLQVRVQEWPQRSVLQEQVV